MTGKILDVPRVILGLQVVRGFFFLHKNVFHHKHFVEFETWMKSKLKGEQIATENFTERKIKTITVLSHGKN